jgi:hypothetical protein
MGKVSIFCVLVIFALLLEDSSSVRKKTEEERKEDEEVARAVNATLAEEEKKRKEEDEKKGQQDQEKKEDETKKKKVKEESSEGSGGSEGRDEALPSFNSTCPVCPEVQDCPVANCSGQGEACPEVKPCPKCKDPEECPPVLPCPVVNRTSPSVPDGCPDPVQAMTIPVAMAVGAGAALLVTGVATVVGLVIRYVPPTVSGFLFMAIIIFVWYLSSQYPETARELGGRAWTTLQEATMALGQRIVEAIRHHNEQVGFPVSVFFYFLLSTFKFHVHLKSLH